MKPVIGMTAAALLIAAVPSTATARIVCRDNIPATTPDSRFVDNGDGTVNDIGTGLMWKKCPEGLSGPLCTIGVATSHTWQEALILADVAEFAGQSDWRLPNRTELASLVERKCKGPSINDRFFPNAVKANPKEFWSSSLHASIRNSAWAVGFWRGLTVGFVKTSPASVRLVRDLPAPAPQPPVAAQAR